MPLCQCCKAFIATAYGPGGFHEMAVCSRCFLKLKSVMVAMQAPWQPTEQVSTARAEARREMEIEQLEELWRKS